MLRFASLPLASAWPVALLGLLSLANLASCFPNGLLRRASALPAPISFAPDQNWEGIDGTWNTFVLRIGTPSQAVRVMVSTASQQIWAVDPRGCPDDTSANTTCTEARGMTYNYRQSSSWKLVGLYDLWIESNLGLGGNAEYGYDTVGLGYPGEGGPTLTGQTVGALATDNFYFGHFGIDPKPTNFTNFTTQSPSFMTTLKDQGKIPSVSWGYTTGVPYRFAKVLGSLTLGGYDSSKFIPNGVSFPFAPDNERDILVAVTSVNSVDSTGKRATLLSSSIYSYIDSTVAEIWLPIEACLQFEQTFGLTYDEASELYLLSEGQHNALLISNPNITITVAPYTQPAGQNNVVSITLPYAAFDQTAKPPYQNINASSRYFPLRRATNESEYTLGRTFLQEAYLTVDWERSNFSVAQCAWASNAQSTIVPILPIKAANSSGNNSTTSVGHMSSLGVGAIAGIAVGAVAILLFSTLTVIFYLRHKHKQARLLRLDDNLPTKTVDTVTSHDDDDQNNTFVLPKAELDATESKRPIAIVEHYKPDGPGSSASSHAGLHESDSKERAVFEMEGDIPPLQEADGRNLSEKEAIRAREAAINGTDPGVSPITPNGSDRSPTSTLATGTLPSSTISSIRPPPKAFVKPGDVIELNDMDNNSIPGDSRTLLVSPLDGSNGANTMMFPGTSPLSPIDGPESDAEATRKRFSYEDP